MVEGPLGEEGPSERPVATGEAESEAPTDSASGSAALAAAGASTDGSASDVKAASTPEFKAVRFKLKGLNDEMGDANAEITQAIIDLAKLVESCTTLQMRPAQTEAELQEALKLYRDMNHLSLAGGITCEQATRMTRLHQRPASMHPPPVPRPHLRPVLP